MQIREAVIEEKEKWNKFIRTNECGSFTQSWDWSEFMATQKDQVWRLVVEDDQQWLAVIFLFKSKCATCAKACTPESVLPAPITTTFSFEKLNIAFCNTS